MMDMPANDALTALRLQIEWGADEALETEPVDRLRPPPVRTPSAPMIVSTSQDAAFSATTPAAGTTRMAASVMATSGTATSGAARVTHAERAARLAAEATTLPELRAAIAAFDGSALRDTATNLVFLEGDPACGLLFIGDAPNGDADRAGSPFAGPVGAYLELMLHSIGLGRDSICLAPLLPWRPPGDRPPSANEIATCLPFLHRLIKLMAPRRIVTLGPLPARALLGTAPVRRSGTPVWRETTIPQVVISIPTLPMPSVAIVLRTSSQRRRAWADLRQLRHSLDTDVTQM
jgi:DNA polymerase